MRLISMPAIKLTCILILSSLLTACGFHLRGDYSVPSELHAMSLTSYDQYSAFTRMVRSQLRMNEIDIVSPGKDIPNLHLISESVGERTLSLYQNTRAAEKELTLRTSYRVTVPNLGSKTLSTSVTRSYLDNPLTALAKSVERDMLEDEMRQVAASQIIRQMARLKADISANEIQTDIQEKQIELNDEQYDVKTSAGSESIEPETPSETQQ
ncbi:LPS assembly lipoprotein LptE [Vibrio olivae]|uniref:LPS-assembly lipoprotein LptE n=1 Tax=Vibrio olivae TaxID=1243002 RepID=A0ABV5HGY9_9VIBR